MVTRLQLFLTVHSPALQTCRFCMLYELKVKKDYNILKMKSWLKLVSGFVSWFLFSKLKSTHCDVSYYIGNSYPYAFATCHVLGAMLLD